MPTWMWRVRDSRPPALKMKLTSSWRTLLSGLSAMATWHRALAHLTRHSKTLIHPSCKGILSLWIFGFPSDQIGLNAHWSRDTWPDYFNMQNQEILRFRILIESCALLILLLTKCLCYNMLQSYSPAMQSLPQMRDKYCCTGVTNTIEIIFHYRKCI
jgi:hypothetical protein